jgi:hypothetical protein
MAVHQFSGIADGVTGNGALTKTVDGFVFNRTRHYLKAERGEQTVPEGQKLVHIQPHRHTDFTPLRFAIDACRRIYLEGCTLAQVSYDFLPMIIVAAITLPTAAWLFRNKLS